MLAGLADTARKAYQLLTIAAADLYDDSRLATYYAQLLVEYPQAPPTAHAPPA